jgi:hypothetical protein|tara:strand:- start:39 stop:419 length:381 start_codon:yes stop_codon:yes gene_type:complete
MKDEIKSFLNKCQIIFDDVNFLNGMKIPREILLSQKTYENVKPHITEMKKMGFSSSSLTALQKNADSNQKWPLLNLVRQILKASNYNMVPHREANGRTKEGKKKYKRFFIIKKFKAVIEAETSIES